MRRAARIDANHTEIVRTLRALGCTVQDLSRVGEGCPDILVGVCGRNILMEIKDGSDEVEAVFPETGPGRDGVGPTSDAVNCYGNGLSHTRSIVDPRYANSGSASRYFYCAKASKRDREEGVGGEARECGGMAGNLVDGQRLSGSGEPIKTPRRTNHHPTVKPLSLMSYLCRLITPPGGLILDPFSGSGSTGKAAMIEGFRFVGIEQDAEYIEIARQRIEWAQEQKRW